MSSKTFVVGDIHGCYDEFIALSDQIGITEDDLVISLGDIVDRGNKSLELYQYFKNRKNAVVLMGNHERKHLRRILSYSQEIVKVQFGDTYQEFLDWLPSLPYFYETEDAIIVHAFFEHDVNLYQQKEEVLSGTTAGSRYLEKKYAEGTYWSDYYTGEKPVIYGHHVVGDAPKIKNNTYGIDTGACHAGFLTILELPSFQIHQLKVQEDYWKNEQSKWQVPVLNAKDWERMKIDQVFKQIQKLDYKKEPEIVSFLQDLHQWITKVCDTIPLLKDKCDQLTDELKAKHATNFHREVAKLPYSGFIFKANSGRLQVDDLKNSLDTPRKVIDLATQLGLSEIPLRQKQ